MKLFPIGERTVTEVYGNCVDVPLGMNTISERSHLTIMPNPAKEMAWVNVPEGSWNGNWELLDAMGRVVKNINPSSSSQAQLFSIDLSDLSIGVYILRIQDSKGRTAIGRLVKN